MIPVPVGVKVWLATGHTDMRKGFPGLSLMVREARDDVTGWADYVKGRIERFAAHGVEYYVEAFAVCMNPNALLRCCLSKVNAGLGSIHKGKRSTSGERVTATTSAPPC